MYIGAEAYCKVLSTCVHGGCVLGVRGGVAVACLRVFAPGAGHVRTCAIACGMTAVGMGAMPHLAALAL